MEMWKSDIGGEFTESRNNGEGCERALSFSITYKGCYNFKIDCSNLLFHKISCYRWGFFFIFFIFYLDRDFVLLMLQVSKMLMPEKWESTFDSNGKVSGFRKALKLIVLGVCCLVVAIFCPLKFIFQSFVE